MIGILKPARDITRLPEQEVASRYKRLRIKVFVGIFVGYAGYYLAVYSADFTFQVAYASFTGI